CNNLLLVLTNNGSLGATNITVTLFSTTPGAVVAQPRSAYPDLPVGTAATNAVPFKISTSPLFVCGLPINLSVLIKCDQVTVTNLFSLPTGISGPPLRFDNFSAAAIPDVGETNSVIMVTNVNF